MLISLILVLVVIGVVLLLLQQIPMDPTIALIIRVLVILAAVLYVLRATGMWHGGFGL